MRSLFQKNSRIAIQVLLIVVIWRLLIQIPQVVGNIFIPNRIDFQGIIPWANLDGVHYLSIAERGYFSFQQAFFPLFPLVINAWANLLRTDFFIAGLQISFISLFFIAYFFIKIILIDFSPRIALWSIIFMLTFPTAFFLGAIYTESLFLALILASFYFARKGHFLTASILSGLASATRLVGIFMIPSLLYELYIQKKKRIKPFLWQYISILAISFSGLASYMIYLFIKFGDPLLFISVQSGFGAGRSGGEIILLPQVMWRYFKIFITVPITNYDYWIAILEVIIFSLVILLLWLAYKKGIRKSYILFATLSLILPTLSGTLSSIPRYALVAFPIFILLGLFENRIIRYTSILLGITLQVVLAALFLRGYFVS